MIDVNHLPSSIKPHDQKWSAVSRIDASKRRKSGKGIVTYSVKKRLRRRG